MIRHIVLPEFHIFVNIALKNYNKLSMEKNHYLQHWRIDHVARTVYSHNQYWLQNYFATKGTNRTIGETTTWWYSICLNESRKLLIQKSHFMRGESHVYSSFSKTYWSSTWLKTIIQERETARTENKHTHILILLLLKSIVIYAAIRGGD